MSHVPTRVLAAATFVVVGVLAALPATAGNFNYGDDSELCNGAYTAPCPRTNKNFYRYYDANLPTTYETATSATHNDTYTAVPGWNSYTSSHADSDVHYLIDDLPSGVAGSYTCSTTAYSNQQCSHGHVRYDVDFNYFSAAQKKALACHETAHSVGLHHPNSDVFGTEELYGCVSTPHIFRQADAYPYIGQHSSSHMQVSNPY